MSDSIIPNLFPDAFDFAVLGMAVLILAVPRRYALHVMAWLAIPVVLTMVELGHPPHWQRKGIGHTIALAWLLSAGLLLGGAILVKSVGIAVWARWRRRAVFSLEGWEPGPIFGVLQRALFLCWGVLAAFLVALFLRKLLQGMSPAWLAHVIALAFVGLLWAVPKPTSVPSAPVRNQMRRKAWRLFITSGRLGLAGFLAAAAIAPVYVGANTAEIADGAPYCIQVADGNRGHRPARSLLDLSFLTMKAARMHGEQQHALLVVEAGSQPRLYNWSYRQLGFVNEAAYGESPRYWPALTCRPQRDFAERLPYVLPAAEDTRTVTVLDRTLQIPAVYRPRARGNWFPRITLYVRPPFSWSLDGPDDPRAWFGSPVQLYPGRWQTSFREFANPAEGPIGGTETVHDLAKSSRTVERGGRSIEVESFIKRDETGVRTTSIYCHSIRFAEPFSCEHTFVHDGMLFRFRQRPEDIADWARIQGWLTSQLGLAAFSEPRD